MCHKEFKSLISCIFEMTDLISVTQKDEMCVKNKFSRVAVSQSFFFNLLNRFVLIATAAVIATVIKLSLLLKISLSLYIHTYKNLSLLFNYLFI